MLTLRASPLLYTKQDYIIDMLPCHINNVPSTLYQGLFIRVVGHIASRKNIANVANVYSIIFTTYPYPLSPTPYPLPLTPELAVLILSCNKLLYNEIHDIHEIHVNGL